MTTPAVGRQGDPHPSMPGSIPTPADRIRQAAGTERYWVLAPTAGAGWALRQLDDTTGHLGDIAHRTHDLVDAAAAKAWATDLVGADGWQPTQVQPGGYIEHAYPTVRSIAHYPRPGRSLVLRVEVAGQHQGRSVAVLRERWDAAGCDSDPLAVAAPFAADAEMLAWASARYGLDRARWQPGHGGEYLLR